MSFLIVSVNCSKLPGVAIVSGFGGRFAGSVQGFAMGLLCAAKINFVPLNHWSGMPRFGRNLDGDRLLHSCTPPLSVQEYWFGIQLNL